MARSNWKPLYLSRKYAQKVKKIVKRIVSLRRIFRRRLLRGVSKATNLLTKKHVFYRAMQTKLRGRIRRLIIWPVRCDTVLRVTKRARIWNDMTVGLSKDKKTFSKRGLRRFYVTRTIMSTEKFGNFLPTRFSGGYRVNKDRAKIEKFHNDLVKYQKTQAAAAKRLAKRKQGLMETKKPTKKKKR